MPKIDVLRWNMINMIYCYWELKLPGVECSGPVVMSHCVRDHWIQQSSCSASATLCDVLWCTVVYSGVQCTVVVDTDESSAVLTIEQTWVLWPLHPAWFVTLGATSRQWHQLRTAEVDILRVKTAEVTTIWVKTDDQWLNKHHQRDQIDRAVSDSWPIIVSTGSWCRKFS